MAVQPVPTLTEIPPFPQTADRASGTYNSKALAFGNHMADTFGDEIEALADNVHHNATEAATAATTLSGAADAATDAAIAASADRVLAQTAAGTATSKAGETSADRVLAQAAATAASNSASQAAASAASASAIVLGVSTGHPAIRPTLLLDFANSRSVDPRITSTRASAATRTNEKGSIETVAANVPRIDFDPVSGACMGLLIEESRTNYITNNTMQGAVVGSPGTTPTGWLVPSTANGITRTVVATGQEDGINYVDIRFNGTPTVNNVTFAFAASNAFAASSGQVWAVSAYLRLVDGSFANTSPVLDILETDGTNGVGTNPTTCVATSAPLATQRFVGVTTVDAIGVTHVQPRIRIGLTIGQPVDFTLRIGLPQFEAGGFSTSVIHTAGAAATRAADLATMTGANFTSWYRQDEGTFVVESETNSTNGATSSTVLSAFASSSNYKRIRHVGGLVDITAVSGGALVVDSGGVAVSVGTFCKTAMAYKSDDYVQYTDGVSGGADTSAALPVGVAALNIGSTDGAGNFLNGHIRCIAYYPKRLSNSELQALTA